jgi:hypothetical protein
MEHSKAPVIHNTGAHGIYVEGDDGASPSDRQTLDLAAAAYGHLVGRNTRMTGAQWSAAIARQYDASEPRHAAVLDVISRLMLCKQFDNDCLLYRDGEPVWRGRAEQCATAAGHQCARLSNNADFQFASAHSAPIGDCERASVAMARYHLGSAATVVDATQWSLADGERMFDRDPFGLPAHWRVVLKETSADARASLWSRKLELLKGRSVGSETFSDESSGDHEAQVALIADLIALAGYQALTAAKPVGATGPLRGSSLAVVARTGWPQVTMPEIEESMRDFLGGLAEWGWSPSPATPVFLCRPAPLVNPLAAMQAYESLVHHSLIGWRLPQALVQRMFEQARELEAQRDAATPHTREQPRA